MVLYYDFVYFFFFFFQAEDGIRDADVTGVQTCALPIFPDRGKYPDCQNYPNTSWLPYYTFFPNQCCLYTTDVHHKKRLLLQEPVYMPFRLIADSLSSTGNLRVSTIRW